MNLKKMMCLIAAVIGCSLLLIACGKEEPVTQTEAETVAQTEATEETQETMEVFAGELDGTIRVEGGKAVLVCDTTYSIPVDGKLTYVETAFFDASGTNAAAQLDGQHVKVKVRGISEEADGCIIDAEFIEGQEILVPMGQFFVQYPAQWGEYLAVAREEQERIVSYTFLCRYEAEEYPLFVIQSGDGLEKPFGFMLLPEREMEISLNSLASVLPADVTDARLDVFNGMQEDINYVIDKLQQNPMFNPAA